MSANKWRRVFAFFDVSNPLVAWLVYRAEIVSARDAHEAALSFWTTRYLASVRAGNPRAERYRTEIVLDEVRHRRYPDAVSRLGGFYVFPDEDSARRASCAWGGVFRCENLAELALRPDARISRYDSEWVTHKLGPEDDLAWADDYFAGNQFGAEPIWEIVVEGRALILGTDLRENAYETVKSAWPASLPLLELARIAVELNSDLGLITPSLIEDRGRRRVSYVMNFKDAKAEAFLENFGSFTGPKNTQDLQPESDLVMPNLSHAQFYI